MMSRGAAAAPIDRWFTQQLDHFDALNTQTWQQRYYINDTFFNSKKRDGPIFLLIGGETKLSTRSMTQGMWIEWAQKHSALCIQVEHRFYGKSHPTSNVTTENLKYLSSQQALADLAYFITSQKTAMNLTSNKWIVFGGSYAGSLAAWFRLKYHHLAYGAVSSSAPILAKVNFKEYYEIVGNSMQTSKHGSKCTDAIRTGINTLYLMIQSNSCKRENITSLFKLSSPFKKSNTLDVQRLFQFLADHFAGQVQYNNNPNWPGPNIDALCDIMTNGSLGTPLQRLGAVNTNILANVLEESCLDIINYTKSYDYIQKTDWDSDGVSSGYRPWFYQACTEFAFLQTSDSTKQPFGNGFPLNFLLRQQCTDIFGPKFNSQLVNAGADWTNVLNGGLNLVLNRTVFSNGSLDPWFALGMTTNTTGNLAYFIKGGSHVADLHASSPKDPPPMVAAKLAIGAQVKAWVRG